MLLFFMVVSTTRAYFSNRCIDSLLNIKTSPDIGQCRYLQNLHQLLYILLTLISFLQVVLHLIERCLKYLLQWLFLCYYWVHVSLLNADCVNLTDWYLNSLNVMNNCFATQSPELSTSLLSSSYPQFVCMYDLLFFNQSWFSK